MIIKYLFKVVGVISLMTVSLAKKSKTNCEDIEDYLNGLENIYHKDDYISYCKVNDKGEVIELDLESYSNDLTEENLLYVLQYKTYKKLILDKFNISQKSLDIIKSLPNLTELSISNKVKSNLNFDNGFKKLTSLSLSWRNVENIEEGIPNVIYKLTNLKQLSLRFYNLNQDDIEGISNLTKLKELHFYNCKTNNLDWSPFKKLKKITKLELYKTTKNYPDFINSLSNLKELIFTSSEPLKTIPSSMLKLVSLEKLIIGQNEITKIPDEIKNLKNLKYLDMSFNDISKFSNSLGSLENLEVLLLNNNQINDTLPESLNNLTHLKEIYLENNINVKGKTLSNESLNHCRYGENYDICVEKRIECVPSNFKDCQIDNPDDKISTDGKCGKGKGKCPNGKCCSKYGWCGTSNDHCLANKGCQENYGKCKSENTSTNHKCGPEYGKCPTGKCCSKYGWCGTSDDYCLATKGCQSEFGDCKKEKISTNNKCGSKDGKCPNGKCCSKYGWCGTSDDHCLVDKGCQSEFGDCKKEKISTNDKCGSQDGKCPNGKCCSKYGWCGTSEKHCGTGCQSKYGICN